MNYKIERGIKIPPRRHGGKLEKYPFAKMKVGDSFFVQDRDPKRAVLRLNSVSYSAGKRYGYRFVVRREDDGARVWRVRAKKK